VSDFDLTRWLRVSHADGSVVLTAPPNHPAFAAHRRATLRIRHDVRPIATLEAVCDGLRAGTAEPRRPRIDRAEPTERLVTRSGEFGAFRHLRVTVGDEALNWAVGLIASDDRMTIIDGLARSPNIVALVRDVLDGSVWTGAYDRIRMVPYRPPAGWFGVRRSMATCWLAPDAPREPAVIVVCDAVPRGPAERMHALVWPLETPERATRVELDGAALPGELATWTVDGRSWAVVRLADARWSVRAALQAGDDQHVIVLRDLVRSIELPPPPASDVQPGLDLYGWMAM